MTGITIITEDELRAKIAKGLTTAQIAESFGVKTPAVTRACHRFGTGLPASGRMPPSAKEPTRKDDERLLAWLAKARRGWSVAEIAKAYGYASGKTVQMQIKAVEVDDLASGDPVFEVARAYQRRWAA